MELLRLSLRRTDVTLVASVKQISGAALTALLFAICLTSWTSSSYARGLEEGKLSFLTKDGTKQVIVEIADDEQERASGLMFRRSLSDDRGMIFLYPQEGPVAMWMKNTYISLDMIFVRNDGTIHHIEEYTEPFSERTISSQGDVRAVIELKAGSVKRLRLSPGDKVDFPAFR